jgi:hypothetical protein
MSTPEQTATDRMKALAEALWNDAELGVKVQAKAKEMFPDAKTNADVIDPLIAPYRKQQEELSKQLSEMREERAAERRASEEQRTKQTLEQALESARKNYSLTEEGFDKMVSRMKETGNYSDADAAAAWVASKAPPKDVKGPTYGAKRMNLFGVGKYDESMKALHQDPLQYLDDQLEEFVSNPDKYVAETFGTAA